MLAVVGPAGSQEVLAVAPIFKKSQRMPFISGSATKTSLTAGWIPNFFRIVPNDSVQSPTTAKFIRQVLKAKSVFIVDDQTAYSSRWRTACSEPEGGRRQGHPDLGQPEGDRLLVARVSRSATTSTSSSCRGRSRPTRRSSAEQMKEQAKKAIIVGSDAMDSGDFKIQGSYISAFAPDIRRSRATPPSSRATERRSSPTSARRSTLPRTPPSRRSTRRAPTATRRAQRC